MRPFSFMLLIAIPAGLVLGQPGASAQTKVHLRQSEGTLVLTNMPRPELARLSVFRARHKEEYRRMAEEAAQRHSLDFKLLDAVIEAESRYQPKAVSPKGARGLMQIMPKTGWELGLHDAFDPAQNIDAGARYLRAMLDRFGSVELALAAYNAGPKAVEKHSGIPPYLETRQYVKVIMGKLGRAGYQIDAGICREQPAESSKIKASGAMEAKEKERDRKSGKVRVRKTMDGKTILQN